MGIHGPGQQDRPGCRVAWLDHKDMQRVSSDDLSDLDYVFTDSRAYAPFRGRNGAAPCPKVNIP